MGLLDFLQPGDQSGLLELLRNSAQKQSLNDGNADTANYPAPPLVPQPPQPSFAGPGLAADAIASSANRAHAAVPLPRPRLAEAPTDSWATPMAFAECRD